MFYITQVEIMVLNNTKNIPHYLIAIHNLISEF